MEGGRKEGEKEKGEGEGKKKEALEKDTGFAFRYFASCRIVKENRLSFSITMEVYKLIFYAPGSQSICSIIKPTL